ncbi:hypothetical protein BT63DRAFT_436634 [Microthyrium microscopicum]|uniref:MYND-type domain-containing protein n=1 Tax=Microthyrium microscopicum TaxID=703497 RepID=A0A6A6UKJ5_9PEZI|nr:hypothetical protein BT63DRAFT_436634 [Microthyrium microscopicum]
MPPTNPSSDAQPAPSNTAPETKPCAICQAPDARRCAKCLSAWYCSKECQTTDWKNGHKQACNKDNKPSTDKKQKPARPPPKGLSQHIDKPFTRLEHKTFLHDLPEKDVYTLLLDSYRMRQEDEYKFGGDADVDSIYGGAPHSLKPFRRFLRRAEKKSGILPAWWDQTKQEACVAQGMGGDEWSDLSCCVEKHDIVEHYDDPQMPMKLRMLAETFCGVGPWGTSGKGMRQMMMAAEGNSNTSTMNFDMSNLQL